MDQNKKALPFWDFAGLVLADFATGFYGVDAGGLLLWSQVIKGQHVTKALVVGDAAWREACFRE